MGQNLPPAGPGNCQHVLCVSLLFSEIGQNQVRSLLGKGDCNGAADPAVRPGDDRRLPLEPSGRLVALFAVVRLGHEVMNGPGMRLRLVGKGRLGPRLARVRILRHAELLRSSSLKELLLKMSPQERLRQGWSSGPAPLCRPACLRRALSDANTSGAATCRHHRPAGPVSQGRPASERNDACAGGRTQTAPPCRSEAADKISSCLEADAEPGAARLRFSCHPQARISQGGEPSFAAGLRDPCERLRSG
jgi:hypothetical protein